MSNQDSSDSVALKPQQTNPNTPSINDDANNKINDGNDSNNNNKEVSDVAGSSSSDNTENTSADASGDIKNVRSESVIKSPSILSSPTPVIQVVDTSSQNTNVDDSNNDATTTNKRSQPETTSTTTMSTNQTSSGNFLKPISNIAPNNPFLRASSFHSNSASNSENSDSNSENQIIFAPPKLIPSSNKYDTNFLTPTTLKTSESNLNDVKKPSETISASKMFISLNKEDIGKIKTPEFIKNTSLVISNGSTLSENKDEKCQPSTSQSSSKGTFLFGQKLEDRVVFDSNLKNSSNNDLKPKETINKTDHLISFSDVTKCEESETSELTKTDSEKNAENSTPGSSAVTKNGEDNTSPSSLFKRKYEVITGEEDEQNVLTIYGKLYAWDTEKASWVEKGRGHLRLNDVMKNDRLCSRLVMRTAGALRLILNAHIVVGMTFELASENCLRFTYVDGIYMIKANPKDIDQLHSAIEHRLREITKRAKLSTEESE